VSDEAVLDNAKVPTGIAGLDEILGGGLPPRRSI
jgi:KaiC/GvpD/RAD55 family RecA-like ATPase